MKKILFLFLIIMISSCCTPKYIEVPVEIKPEFEPVPEREILEQRGPDEELVKFLTKRINYFSELVKLWESWGISVYESVDLPLPESLQLLEDLGGNPEDE